MSPVHAALLSWYGEYGRDLPWRRTRDPYPVLVSEVMLQQTGVERVKAKYGEFLAAFPSFAALAAAPLADVIRLWAPLGYNRRAVRLHAIARTVCEKFGGRLPHRVHELRGLDGLGSYTASAVACFAFDQDVPVVDTNVRRVLTRFFGDVPTGQSANARTLENMARSVLPERHAYEWNQALMDLGSTICTARTPRCGSCPVALFCTSRASLESLQPRTRSRRGDRPVAATRAAERRSTYQADLPFTQTTRYFRGRIVHRLRQLRSGDSLSIEELGQALRPDFGPEHRAWLAELVEGLRRDGLVAVVGRPNVERVRLP